MTTLFRALFLTLIVFIPVSAAADSHLSSDPKVVHARVMVMNEHFETALELLRALDRDHPDRVEILFLTGLAAMGAAGAREDEAERALLLDGAIAALRAILIDRPELTRVRLELARAFFLKGEDDLARDHFERVLASRPPPAVADNIGRFLAQIRARKRWSFNLGFALAPDSNIGSSSDERIIYIFDLPFRRDAQELTTSGIGVALWGGAEYQHPLSDRWRLRAGASLSRREYAGRDFDQTSAAIHLGPRWLASRNTEASLLAAADQGWTAGESNSRALGPVLEIKHRLTPRLTAQGHASWKERTYRTSRHLDGPRMSLSVGGSWVVTPTVRLDSALGYGRERPQALAWRNATRWVEAGVSVALPRGFTVGAGGEYRWTDYQGVWFPFVSDGGAREDRTHSLRASVHNRAFTVLGFSPELVVVREERATNAQSHDYERTRGELRFVQQF